MQLLRGFFPPPSKQAGILCCNLPRPRYLPGCHLEPREGRIGLSGILPEELSAFLITIAWGGQFLAVRNDPLQIRHRPRSPAVGFDSPALQDPVELCGRVQPIVGPGNQNESKFGGVRDTTCNTGF